MNKALVLLWACLAALPLAAGIRERQEERRQARLEADLRQLLFGKALVEEARRHLGKPYVWGGKSGDPGFDCSGFTRAVYRARGVDLAAGAQAQLQQGVSVPREGLQAGDLVFFHGRGSPFHVGLYEGGGRFLHAPGAGKRIQSTALSGAWAGRRWIGARRFAPPPLASLTLPPTQEKQP